MKLAFFGLVTRGWLRLSALAGATGFEQPRLATTSDGILEIGRLGGKNDPIPSLSLHFRGGAIEAKSLNELGSAVSAIAAWVSPDEQFGNAVQCAFEHCAGLVHSISLARFRDVTRCTA